MKRVCSVLLAILMVFTLAFGLCACGEDADTSAKEASEKEVKDEDLFVGKWETTMDLSEVLTEGFAMQNEELAEYFQIKDFVITMFYEFDEDGTYETSVDEDSVATAVEKMQKCLEKGIIAYLEATLKEQGIDMTAEQYLEAAGMTLDDLMTEFNEEADPDELVEAFETEGNWKAKKGKLYSTKDTDDEIDKSQYETYEISKDKLVLKEAVGADEEDDLTELMSELYPITLKRVK